MIGSVAFAQVPSNLMNTEVDDLSDAQIMQYWEQAKAEGYTLEQLKTIAVAKGVPATKIAEFEQRLRQVQNETSVGETVTVTKDELAVDSTDKMGREPVLVQEKNTKDSTLFGYDFFNNPNISFSPNQNLATPASYELGPGDEVVINIWGAAENNYTLQVNREGAIRIPTVGPVFVSGFTMKEAREVVRSRLKQIYAGINASDNSPYKVFVNVALSSVRTVQVNIIGQVEVPGTYNLSALSTVLNALYASGGPTKQGTMRKVKLVRNGEEIVFFDIYDYLVNGSQEGNKTLQDQDIIIVQPYVSRVTITGAVKRPGIFELLPDESFSDLLKFTSGFTSNAYKERVVLERIQGDRKVIREIIVENANTIPLQDGDIINVRQIIDKFENRIRIEGAVYRPGTYEYTEGLTVEDLIEKAAGVKDDAFLERGLLYSTEDGVTESVTAFSIRDVISGNMNLPLKPDDRVKIFNKYDLQEERMVSINGAVNSPGSFPYIESLSIEDLVIMAGGFQEGANVNQIDVFRKVTDNEFETLSQSFNISANGTLELEGGESFILGPGDRVSVRYLRGVSDEKNVMVNGEVNYPGAYVVENKNAKISDLVELAGGLSPYAFVQGATLVRLNPFYKAEGQEVTFNNLNDDTELEEEDIRNKREFRVGIDLKKILEEPSSKYNMVLKNGDRLIIPSLKETVKVEGEVLAPSLVRFDKSYSLRDYIDKSGGFATDAKKNKTYVVYANGDIASTKQFLFFRSYPKLRPGAVILVPQKPEDRNKISAQEVVGISTGLTTLGLLIDRLLQ